MTNEERIARGRRATQELRVTEQAFMAVKQRYTEEMLAATDPAEIMRLHQCVGTVEMVRKALFLAVGDGQMAEAIAEAN